MVSDPKLGRFITADTVVQDPYNPQTLNRYNSGQFRGQCAKKAEVDELVKLRKKKTTIKIDGRFCLGNLL